MSDGTRLNLGAGGDTIWTEDVGSPNGKIPVSKIILGNENDNDGDVSATNPLPVYNQTSSGVYFSNVGGSDFGTIKAAPGRLYSLQIQNTSSSIVYVQLFDSVSPTVGSTTPVISLFIPASGGYDAMYDSPLNFNTGITFTTTTTPTGSTAPSSASNCNFLYS